VGAPGSPARHPRCGRVLFFFFQAEDGIRDRNVTGVQTCALPICRKGAHYRLSPQRNFSSAPLGKPVAPSSVTFGDSFPPKGKPRSEERRVGKEGGARRWPAPDRRNAVDSRGAAVRGRGSRGGPGG